MKFLIYIIIYLSMFSKCFAIETVTTEITADDGIEVFQEEKYYLLKKNVKIVSENFNLTGELVKIFFDNDLYDITKIDAIGDVNLKSKEYGIETQSNEFVFIVIDEEIILKGNDSKLLTDDIEMFSNGLIKLNNITGKFKLDGENSKLKNREISISSDLILGKFTSNNETKDIEYLETENKDIGFIKTSDTELISKTAIYRKKDSIIELFENVRIKRGNETIEGDYGQLDTKNSSYKIKSNNDNKVKIIITNKDE